MSLRQPSPFDMLGALAGDEPLPCAAKLSFDTKRQADTAANVAQYQRGLALKAYRCRYCSLWHLATDYGDEP